MSRRRAVTLAELMLGMVMLVVLTFATMSLYSFSTQRVAAQGADSAVQIQAAQLVTEITKTVSQCKSCSLYVSGGHTALVCVMPATGTDQDFDGVPDHFSPDGTVNGKEIYNTGFYVWYYLSDATGIWGRNGSQISRSVVSNGAIPGAGNVDSKWAQYYGGPMRWNLIDSVVFSPDPVTETTDITISASSLLRADRSAVSDPTAPSRSFSQTFTVFWQNFRNMIVNGSFEYPDNGGANWTYVASDGCTGGWVKSSADPVEIQTSGYGAISCAGNQHLELDSNDPSSIKQTIPTVPGQQYTLSLYYTPRPGCISNKIDVRWDGSKIATLNGFGLGLPLSAAWARYSYTVTATSTSTDLEFVDKSFSFDGKGGLLDNVVLMPK